MVLKCRKRSVMKLTLPIHSRMFGSLCQLFSQQWPCLQGGDLGERQSEGDLQPVLLSRFIALTIPQTKITTFRQHAAKNADVKQSGQNMPLIFARIPEGKRKEIPPPLVKNL